MEDGPHIAGTRRQRNDETVDENLKNKHKIVKTFPHF